MERWHSQVRVGALDSSGCLPYEKTETFVKASWEDDPTNGSGWEQMVFSDNDDTKNLRLEVQSQQGRSALAISNASTDGGAQAVVEVPLEGLKDEGVRPLAGAEDQIEKVELRRNSDGYSVTLFAERAESPQSTWHIVGGEVKSAQEMRPTLKDSLPEWAFEDRSTYLSSGALGAASTAEPLTENPGRVEEMNELFEMTEMDEDPNNDMAPGLPGVVMFPTGHGIHFGKTDGVEWMVVGNGVETPDGWIDNRQLYERDSGSFRSYSFEQIGDKTHTSVAAFDRSGQGTISKRGPSLIEEFFRSMEGNG